MAFSFADGAALLSGAIVGFVLGLIGGGGSIFATPLLYYFVGVADPHIAIGTGAAAVSVNALTNLLSLRAGGSRTMEIRACFRRGRHDWRVYRLGSRQDRRWPEAASPVRRADARGRGADGLQARGAGGRRDWRTAKTAARALPALLGIGTIVGVLSGFFGIGGGFLVVPGILAATGMPMINAIASSLVSVTAFGAATAASYAWSGLVDWRIATLLLVGGLFGGLFGAWLAGLLAVRRRLLSQIFSAAVAGVGLYVIARGALALMKA